MGATPIVTPMFPVVSAAPDQVFAASQLFSTSGDPLLSYEVEDETTSRDAGFWVLNGAVLPSGQIVELSAGQLSELSFVAGIGANGPEIDTLQVAASNASGFGAFASFEVDAASPTIAAVPAITAANVLEAPQLDLAASSLFSASVAQDATITAYEVEDATLDSGR